jgi:hypothetical protein
MNKAVKRTDITPIIDMGAREVSDFSKHKGYSAAIVTAKMEI